MKGYELNDLMRDAIKNALEQGFTKPSDLAAFVRIALDKAGLTVVRKRRVTCCPRCDGSRSVICCALCGDTRVVSTAVLAAYLKSDKTVDTASAIRAQDEKGETQ